MKNIIVGEHSLDGWHNLWLMTHEVCGVTRSEYLNGFEHTSTPFSLPSLRPGGKMLTVVALGHEVVRALDLPEEHGWITSLVRDGVVWRQVPCPGDSWYNEPAHRMMVGVLLEELLYADAS